MLLISVPCYQVCNMYFVHTMFIYISVYLSTIVIIVIVIVIITIFISYKLKITRFDVTNVIRGRNLVQRKYPQRLYPIKCHTQYITT